MELGTIILLPFFASMVMFLLARLNSILTSIELCVSHYVGACAIPADLNSHLTDSRLPSGAHEKSIEPSARQTCKKAPLVEGSMDFSCAPHGSRGSVK